MSEQMLKLLKDNVAKRFDVFSVAFNDYLMARNQLDSFLEQELAKQKAYKDEKKVDSKENK